MKRDLYTNYHRDRDYQGFERMFRNIFLKRFCLLNKFIVSSGRVLEIGCSIGVFLDLFKEKGWETWGVEPSESGKIAEKKGHKIIHTFFWEAKIPEDYFDVVIFNHTLEHMDEPLIALKKAKAVLNKGGIVLVDVPNFGGISSKIFGKRWPYLLSEEHKHQFTKESLVNIFKEAGFEVVHWESRSGIFEHANPFIELWQSLITFKKRFFINLFTFPYSLLVTSLNKGDSMSLIGKKL